MTASQSEVDTLYCGFDPRLSIRLVLRVRSPLANQSAPAFYSGVTRDLGTSRACSLRYMYTDAQGSLLCRSLER